MNPCPCCNQPMHTYWQSSLLPERPPFQLAECINPDCDLYMATLSIGVHERLTSEQIQGYRKVNREQRTRLEEARTQEDLELNALFAAHGLNRKEYWGDPSEWHR